MGATTPAAARSGPKAVRVSFAILGFAGIGVIVALSLRHGAEESQRVGTRAEPVASEQATVVAREAPPAATRRSGGSGDCGGCGVVESVRRVDTYTEIMVGCLASEGATSPGRGYGLDDNRRRGSEPLADIVATAAAGKPGKRRFAVTTRHQIVVRFRNGSRQVLNEATPRALREGEHVIIIAGLDRTSDRTSG